MQVSLARPSSDNIKGANLYVSGLPRSMTQTDMDDLFAPYGNIVTSRILCDLQTGKLPAPPEKTRFFKESFFSFLKFFKGFVLCHQCFDAVGWAAGRPSGV